MPGTERLYRTERIATGVAAGQCWRTPHFAFRRGTFSRVEFTIELAQVIETREFLLHHLSLFLSCTVRCRSEKQEAEELKEKEEGDPEGKV